ncbi:MAG: phosphate starvation-inducible protein PhoH [Deltaproteobacteria bacterium RIFOXYA12_FULL_61_11]|nr:MAG: phosphate starvation-inducible protein PhoH [Deltaproteobacteria bacterium RIFOXYA12_FULL_61_11]
MTKIFVLDTNILLHDPQVMYGFADNVVIIPIVVIEEIDKFKKELSEVGRNARQISRELDRLRGQGKLSKGIPLPNGGQLRVELEGRSISRVPFILKVDSPDNRILTIALALKERFEDMPVILITKDVNLRVKADSLGLIAEDYEGSKVEIDELYSGTKEYKVPGDLIDRLHREGQIPYSEEAFPNECFLVRDEVVESHTAVARYDVERKILQAVRPRKEPLWGISPRNLEQTMALDLLLNDQIRLVTLVGKAGTGKTLMAMAAGLYATVDQGIYQRLLVSRPIFPLGRDIGYLPGNVEDKLKPWMQPIFDNLELLMSSQNQDGKKRKGRQHPYQELVDMGVIEIEPLTYIRGRSIPNQFLIVDEAQNLTPHEVKTILTRVGTNTKIVLTGDPYQIDNPYVDASSNGLCHVVEKFKAEPLAGHVTLRKGERSSLAEKAANLL